MDRLAMREMQTGLNENFRNTSSFVPISGEACDNARAPEIPK